MKLSGLPVGMIDWSEVPPLAEAGQSGSATARSRQFGDLQLRLVSYSAGYVADHWCDKGHLVFVVDGKLTIEHRDGRRYDLTPGMSYHVADNDGPAHRVVSTAGASIFVVD